MQDSWWPYRPFTETVQHPLQPEVGLAALLYSHSDHVASRDNAYTCMTQWNIEPYNIVRKTLWEMYHARLPAPRHLFAPNIKCELTAESTQHTRDQHKRPRPWATHDAAKIKTADELTWRLAPLGYMELHVHKGKLSSRAHLRSNEYT